MYLKNAIKESIKLRKKTSLYKRNINTFIDLIFKTLSKKKKVFICGNGGSAAEAQHLAAEFLVRLNPKINRRPFPIISLAQDVSTITACSNDYKFEKIFSRNLEGMATNGDLLICLSTSGNSRNILNVLKKAKKIKITSLCFLGSNGGIAKKFSDHSIIIKSKNTALIQEEHLFLGHLILKEVEKKLLRLI